LKKFLVIQTAFIGDAILATAVLEHLRKKLPSARLDVLVRAGNESLFNDHPFVKQVFVWNKKESKYRGLFQLLKSIRKQQYDGVINLQRHAASAFLTMFSGAAKTAGFDENLLSCFFSFRTTHRIGNKGEANYLHEVDRCIQLTSPWVEVADARPRLYPSDRDFSSIEPYTSRSFITISPSSVWFTKQTPGEVWIKLMQSSSDRQIYLLGGPQDSALCESLAEGLSHVQVLAGHLSLLQSAALMSKAEMNYTNDSAPLHLCSAMNAPVTAVFCSTIPEFGFGPLSERSRVVQTRSNLACKPCGIHGRSACPKGHFDCGKIENADLL
jgi:heptosyltransferase-2